MLIGVPKEVKPHEFRTHPAVAKGLSMPYVPSERALGMATEPGHAESVLAREDVPGGGHIHIKLRLFTPSPRGRGQG
jgi:hypothetical protein